MIKPLTTRTGNDGGSLEKVAEVWINTNSTYIIITLSNLDLKVLLTPACVRIMHMSRDLQAFTMLQHNNFLVGLWLPCLFIYLCLCVCARA